MLYHTGDSQHIQNTQINKVICENEKKKKAPVCEKLHFTEDILCHCARHAIGDTQRSRMGLS